MRICFGAEDREPESGMEGGRRWAISQDGLTGKVSLNG